MWNTTERRYNLDFQKVEKITNFVNAGLPGQNLIVVGLPTEEIVIEVAEYCMICLLIKITLFVEFHKET